MSAVEFESLFGKRQGEIKLGLQNMRRALEILDLAGGRPLTITIGGTNGKGTSAGFLAMLCTALGQRVGLYTSPHLRDFGERFWVNGQSCDHVAIKSFLAGIRQKLGDFYHELSFFEVTTLIALSLFREYRVDLQILEVGLGGRLDATNAIDTDMAAVVSVDLDHTHYLGDSLEAIAREKVAIMRPNRPLFVGQLNTQARVMDLVADTCQQSLVPLFCFGRDFWIEDDCVFCQVGALAKPLRFELPLWIAEHPSYPMRHNFALALAMFIHLRQLSNRDLASLEAECSLASRAIGTTDKEKPPSLRARFEKTTLDHPQLGRHLLLLDVCHNPASVAALVEALEQTDRVFASDHEQGLDASVKFDALFCPLLDKDVSAMLDQLRPAVARLALVSLSGERSIRSGDIPERHRDLPLYPSFSEAILRLGKRSAQSPLVICGSLIGVGQALEEFSGYTLSGWQLM